MHYSQHTKHLITGNVITLHHHCYQACRCVVHELVNSATDASLGLSTWLPVSITQYTCVQQTTYQWPINPKHLFNGYFYQTTCVSWRQIVTKATYARWWTSRSDTNHASSHGWVTYGLTDVTCTPVAHHPGATNSGTSLTLSENTFMITSRFTSHMQWSPQLINASWKLSMCMRKYCTNILADHSMLHHSLI